MEAPPQVNEILLRQRRKFNFGRSLFALSRLAEEICGRWLAKEPLVQRVQARAVVDRALQRSFRRI